MRNAPVKILHTADCHLDSPLKSLARRDEALGAQVQSATRQAFARMVQTALSEDVAAVLIAGDLFDGAQRSARTAAFLTAQLDQLNAAGIAVFYIKGNHDVENPITGELSLPENVHTFGARGGKVQLADHDIWIHGVSFANKHAPESLLNKFGQPVPNAINIAMLHTSLAGATGHDMYAPCSVAELTGMGFDYWALGHVHKRQIHSETPWVVMPGIPQGRDIGEAGPKSATLLTIEDGAIQDGAIQISEVHTSQVEFIAHAIDVTGLESADVLRDKMRDVMRALAADLQSATGIVRLTLTGATDLRWQILRDKQIWAETAGTIAQDTDRLALEKLKIDVSDAGALSGQNLSATDELGALMDTIRDEPGFADAFQVELEAVLAELPAHCRAALMPDEPATRELGSNLARAGATQMLARMKGASD